MLSNRLEYSEAGGIGTRVSILLTAAFDALLGKREGLLGHRFLRNLPGKENTTLAPRFRLFGTFIPNNVNAGGSAVWIHKNLLPDEATVTRVGTWPWPRPHRLLSSTSTSSPT